MKSINLKLQGSHLLQVFILIVIVFAPMNRAHAEEFSMYVSDWSPYIDFTQENQGFLSELVRQAMARQGIKLILINHPWNRVTNDIDTNQAISFGWVKNQERLKKWHYSDVLFTNISVLAMRKESDFKWETFEDLKSIRLIGTLGYSYGEDFDRNKPGYKYQESWSDENGMRMMLSKRADAMLIDYSVGQTLLNTKFTKEEAEQIKFITKPPIASGEMFLVCSQSNPKCTHYINLFNQGLKAIQADGTYAKIAPIQSN